jgi:hypothetical protein
MKEITNRRIEVQAHPFVNKTLPQLTKERLTEWPKR